MPWSAKAQELAPEAVCACGQLPAFMHSRQRMNSSPRQCCVFPAWNRLLANTAARLDAVEHYTRAYRRVLLASKLA